MGTVSELAGTSKLCLGLREETWWICKEVAYNIMQGCDLGYGAESSGEPISMQTTRPYPLGIIIHKVQEGAEIYILTSAL